MSELMEQFDGQVDEELRKSALEAELIPGGRYKFQIEEPNIATVDREYFDKEQTKRNPFYGKKVANMKVRLTSKRDGDKKDSPWVTLERPRTTYIRVCPSTVKWESGELTIESKLFGQMIDVAVKGSGEALSNQGVIDYFRENFGEVHITLSEERDDKATGKHYDAKNWIRGIKTAN